MEATSLQKKAHKDGYGKSQRTHESDTGANEAVNVLKSRAY